MEQQEVKIRKLLQNHINYKLDIMDKKGLL